MHVLEIRGLYKSFGGNHVLRGLDMAVPQNSIYGFVGKNGAGKTTTMKIIVGLLKPDRGTVSVCGEQVVYGDTKTNRHIGFLPDVPEFYGYMRPWEYLELCGEIAGLSHRQIKARTEELLFLVGLNGVDGKISGFSRGMKQRLGIAQALLSEPSLLICDEPTSALDPLGRKQVLDILASIKGKTTALFSTHILADVERICDRVAVLHGGRLVLSGTIGDIRKQYRSNSFRIRFASVSTAQEFARSAELNQPTITVIQDGETLTISLKGEDMGGQMLIDLLSAKQMTPEDFHVMEPTLESLFTEVVK